MEAHIAAHAFCRNNQAQLMRDKLCGCCCCLSIFDPKLIQSWIRDPSNTAVCPFCGIDSVIGASSGYPITKEFLTQMKQYWF